MTQRLFASLIVARFDSKEKLIVISLATGPVPERQLVHRLRPDPARVVLRAVRRLCCDRIIEIAQGKLSLTSPSKWPPNRLKDDDLVRLEQILGWSSEDEAAPKLHEVPAVDDWLFPPDLDPMPDVTVNHKPAACAGCAVARKWLDSPNKTLRLEGAKHLATCGQPDPEVVRLRAQFPTQSY